MSYVKIKIGSLIMKIFIGETKAQKGLIRTKIICEGNQWKTEITGDFLIYPEDTIFLLENELSVYVDNIEYYLEKITDFLSKAELFGSNPEDFVNSFKKAYEEAIKEC